MLYKQLVRVMVANSKLHTYSTYVHIITLRLYPWVNVRVTGKRKDNEPLSRFNVQDKQKYLSRLLVT